MPKGSGNTITLSCLMNNGTVLADDKAWVVDTEVVSSILEASSVPRKPSAKVYLQRAWDQPPTPGDEEQREVADPPYPDDDNLFLNRTIPSVHTNARAGMDLERGITNRLGVWMQFASVIGSILFLFSTLALVGVFRDKEPVEPAPVQQQAPPREPPPVILPGTGGQ